MDETNVLTNVSKIQEVKFKISSNRKLFDELFGKDCYSPYFKYAHVVYVADRKFIWGNQTQSKKELSANFIDELSDFIKLYNPSSFKDFLFFIDACPRYMHDPSIKRLAKWKYKRYELVDLVLEESHGLLLWEYQFRQLLTLFWEKQWKHIKEIIKVDPKAVHAYDDPYYQLTSGLFNRRKFYWDMMKWMKFSENFSMYDVLKERAVKQQIVNPHIERAYSLFNFLKEG